MIDIKYIQSPECANKCGPYHSPAFDADIEPPTHFAPSPMEAFANHVYDKWVRLGGDDEYHMARGISYTNENGYQAIYRFANGGVVYMGDVFQ